jgi:predicted dehydrogenase
LRYLLVGLGSIGKRHLANIRKTDPQGSVTIWHTHTQKSGSSDGSTAGARVVYSFDEAIQPRPDIALITSPSSTHIPIAKKFVSEKIDLFIEKPLSIDLDGTSELLALATANDVRIIVGYNFRYHRPLQILKQCIDEGKIGRIISIHAEVGQYLPEWRPGTDYRTSVSARRALGGGAVLELSHELDYVRWFAGEVTTVTAVTDHISSLEIDVEDTAEIILRFENGAMGSVHLDMVQRVPHRHCRVIGSKGTITWDGNTDAVMLYTAAEGKWTAVHQTEKLDRNVMYIEELQQAVRCVRERGTPVVSGEDGRRVLEIALAALQSSREQRCIQL